MIKAEQGRTVADADIFDLSQVVAPHIIGHNSKETQFDQQRLKDQLIEKATARLRRRLLEERLSNVMHNVIEMQSQLEFLRVDAAATIDAVANMDDDNGNQQCRLEALERRLQAHQDQLDQLKKQNDAVATATTTTTTSAATDENSTVCDKPASTFGFSMSRLSSLSLMSSLFSRSNSSISSHSSYPMEQDRGDDDDDDCCSVASFMTEEQQRTHRLRRMRLQRQQPYSRSCMRETNYDSDEDSDNSCDDVLSDIGTLSSASSLSRPRALYEVAPAFAKRLHEHRHPLSPTTPKEYFYEERNVLDDAMSFLDSLSDNADDGGFGQDMDFLLRHPDLCCRPLSEIQETMTEIQRRESQTTLSQWTQAACAQSWKWYKFLNVLTAAVMISVLKGPDDMLDDRV
ncbi:hypothetical protein K492DRAFT_208009 [Lichtheimia hyalospora FSU 10163]|nr:hypothetical protein K492DRAFT_208009 [Lichtheimia hyalospora FSU 10163]